MTARPNYINHVVFLARVCNVCPVKEVLCEMDRKIEKFMLHTATINEFATILPPMHIN